jgi:ribose transport system ATP-binding protein
MCGVRNRFGATLALDGVDLAVAAGEVHGLVGENGAGKSTLMRVLSGALPADAGEMWLDGVSYRPESPLAGRRAGVAMIYQELSLARHLTVEENILLGMEPCRGPVIRRTERRRQALDAMRAAGLDHVPPDARVGNLSPAEQQLVEVARAVAVGSRVLVLDEPTSSLGRDEIRRLFALIRRLRGDGHAIVYISHFLDEVREVCDRFTVLRDGQVVACRSTRDSAASEIASLMVGRDVSDLYPRSARRPGSVALDIAGLAGDRLPRAASLCLHRGEVVGVAGLVGAGRTEFVRAVFGLDPVRRGTVRVGAVVGPCSPAARWAQGVGMVSEDRKREGLALGLSVQDNLTMTRLPFWCSPRGLAADARPWIDRLGIRCRGPAQRTGALSGGNQQKVALARLLRHGVDVLLLDEPTRGIDVASKAEAYRLIDGLACGADGAPPCAVLMISSYLPELLGVCDRIAVMCRGVLGPVRPVAHLDESAIMREATGIGTASPGEGQ